MNFLNLIKLEENYSKTREAISGDPWEKFMASLAIIENLQKREYYSLPIQYMGERTKTTISIRPSDATSKLQSYSTSFVFPIHKVPYWGLSSSFYFAGLKSDMYSVKNVNSGDSTKYYIVDESVKNNEVGLSVMAKKGEKYNDWFGYHASLGLGVSFSDRLNPRVLAGLGGTFGVKNSIVIDLGVITGSVDRLKTVYKDLTVGYSLPPENVTLSKLKVSYFISFGYFFRF
jgi:hypothetical protein